MIIGDWYDHSLIQDDPQTSNGHHAMNQRPRQYRAMSGLDYGQCEESGQRPTNQATWHGLELLHHRESWRWVRSFDNRRPSANQQGQAKNHFIINVTQLSENENHTNELSQAGGCRPFEPTELDILSRRSIYRVSFSAVRNERQQCFPIQDDFGF